MCRCLRSSRRRRKSQGLRLLSIVKNGVNCQGSIIKLKVVLATELLILSCTFVNIAIESFVSILEILILQWHVPVLTEMYVLILPCCLLCPFFHSQVKPGFKIVL